ncbi:hypothetical protein F4777DRAFT_48217 [Nemania sp. FL0916]|nr:hypothetical protein F4777DRAFT_48217 [Nemania sp. FL0916]
MKQLWLLKRCDSDPLRASIFWTAYFLVAQDTLDFIDNYKLASRLQSNFDQELVLFTDDHHIMKIPCSSRADDKELIGQLRSFYELNLICGGLTKFIGFKRCVKIEIVELFGDAIGNNTGLCVNLGREMYYFDRYDKINDILGPDSRVITQYLIDECVITSPSQQQRRALNIVRAWNPQSVKTIGFVPVTLSFIISILWLIIATAVYGADVQTSAQTGFTIGSYVVTAAALIIALVAFLDAQTGSARAVSLPAHIAPAIVSGASAPAPRTIVSEPTRTTTTMLPTSPSKTGQVPASASDNLNLGPTIPAFGIASSDLATPPHHRARAHT